MWVRRRNDPIIVAAPDPGAIQFIPSAWTLLLGCVNVSRRLWAAVLGRHNRDHRARSSFVVPGVYYRSDRGGSQALQQPLGINTGSRLYDLDSRGAGSGLNAPVVLQFPGRFESDHRRAKPGTD